MTFDLLLKTLMMTRLLLTMLHAVAILLHCHWHWTRHLCDDGGVGGVVVAAFEG